jgi:DMSO/TMAO reductase YedYZ molybdopterin-dependent catalytic subunit
MMNESPRLTIDGHVDRALSLSHADLAAMDSSGQIADVSQIDPKRAGGAVTLEALLAASQARNNARWITLHATSDDFHASIPLDEIRERGMVIYTLEGRPLPAKSGGPFRFYIRDFAACHSADVTECANVKFVDRIELSVERGYDNRPTEEEEHAELHRRQAEAEQGEP